MTVNPRGGRVDDSRRNHPSGRIGRGDPPPALSISCDDCAMQCTTACTDCVVTYVLRDEGDADEMELDDAQIRTVRLLVRAGMVPGLRYRAAG
ncbi:MAG TPA: hypothetical protein VGK49_04205 [Ilumatobacteraceae bacterium]